MQLASNLGVNDTSFTVVAGQGSQCPTIAAGDANFILITLTDKNGNKEIVKVIEHLSGSDVFTIGDDESVPHVASVNGRAYEETFDGYQTALAITATDAHKVRMPLTAATFQAALGFAAVQSSANEIDAVCDGNTATAIELSVLDADARAVGDIITKLANGSIGAIADIAVGSYLKSGGVGVIPEYGKMALSDTGVNIQLVTVTGTTTIVSELGFRPSCIDILGIASPRGTAGSWSAGFDTGSSRGCLYYLKSDGVMYSDGARSFHVFNNLSAYRRGTIAMGSDGYTITSEGTINIVLLCRALP